METFQFTIRLQNLASLYDLKFLNKSRNKSVADHCIKEIILSWVFITFQTKFRFIILSYHTHTHKKKLNKASKHIKYNRKIREMFKCDLNYIGRMTYLPQLISNTT